MSKVGIDALRVEFYRGIGDQGITLENLTRLNVFIGPNNAGKSAILRFLADDAPWIEGRKTGDPTIAYRGKTSGPIKASIGISRQTYFDYLVEIGNKGIKRVDVVEFAHAILGALQNRSFWFRHDGRSKFVLEGDEILISDKIDPQLSTLNLSYFFRSLMGVSLPDARQFLKHYAGAAAREGQPLPPKAVLIPAIRSVGEKGSQLIGFSGAGIIDRLSQLQSPDYVNYDPEKELFDKINSLVQCVLNRPKARIEVPHHLEHINVHIDNKVLPLSSLGTGVQQLIMIGAFCCMNDDGIICLEEPETHLHPAMQRKLFDFLMRETSAQYFVATHSAAIIDLPDATVFHVENDGDQTQISLAAAANDRFNACHNLGYRASDIAQANYVLWVEGPSDRVYLINWLKQIDPDLHEGLHYTVMFYGGRLLSRLSVDDEEVDGFINLLALGRKAGIVIDSDMKSPKSSVNDTKTRILGEFNGISGFRLLTHGREIENYVPYEQFKSAAELVKPSAKLAKPTSERYGDYYEKQKSHSSKSSTPEKVKIDKVRIAEALADLDVGDLKYELSAELAELAKAIRAANALD